MAQISESNGIVLFEAESMSGNIPRTIAGTNYSWTNNTGVGGYSGSENHEQSSGYNFQSPEERHRHRL